jgi:hypothetical protein
MMVNPQVLRTLLLQRVLSFCRERGRIMNIRSHGVTLNRRSFGRRHIVGFSQVVRRFGVRENWLKCMQNGIPPKVSKSETHLDHSINRDTCLIRSTVPNFGSSEVPGSSCSKIRSSGETG